MSGHPHDPIEGNSDKHPVRLAVMITVGAIALVIGIILMAKLAVAVYSGRSIAGTPAMSDAAVAKRIAPVAQLSVDPNAPPPAAAAPAAVVAAAAPSATAAGAGKSTYDAVCAVCHAAGVAGAPKAGDKAAWTARLKAAKGKAGLYATSLKGKGAMPPKGGNPSLSDDAVKSAVDYLLATAK